MGIGPQTFSRLPQRPAILDYLAPTPALCFEPHPVVLHDVRWVADFLALDDEGVQVVCHAGRIYDPRDATAVRDVGYDLAAQLVSRVTGAESVRAFGHSWWPTPPSRSADRPGRDPWPAAGVHNDYTERTGSQRVREVLGLDAGAPLARRAALITLWRPIGPSEADMPLAFCDANTVRGEDLAATAIASAGRRERGVVSYNARHRWFYVSGLTADEVVLFKTYDSCREGVARFVPQAVPAAGTVEQPATEGLAIHLLALYPE